MPLVGSKVLIDLVIREVGDYGSKEKPYLEIESREKG